VARSLHASRNMVAAVRIAMDSAEQTTEQLLLLSNGELYELFFPERFNDSAEYYPVNCAYVHDELKKVGVTLKLLWEEYTEECRTEKATPCSYATFTRIYGKYTAKRDYTSHVWYRTPSL